MKGIECTEKDIAEAVNTFKAMEELKEVENEKYKDNHYSQKGLFEND